MTDTNFKSDATKEPHSRGKKTKSGHRRWISLNSLVELEWDKYIRWTVAKHTLLKDKMHIIDHDYDIKPVSPITDDHAVQEFNAGDRFLIIPIKETDGASPRRRCVLVREEHAYDKGRLYIADAEPSKDRSAADGDYFKRIYVIGDGNPELKEREPHIIGAVEAILTADASDLAWPVSSSAPSTQVTPVPSTIVLDQPALASCDEGLLDRLDALNGIKECRGQSAQDIAELQKSLHQYLYGHYDLKVIPIEVNQTRFDENLGHIVAGISHLTQVGHNIITAVIHNGYTRNGELVRKANVVVNRQATRFVRLTGITIDPVGLLRVEMQAPPNLNIGEVIHEAAVQIEALDLLYDWISVFATAQGVTDLKQLAQLLAHTHPTCEDSRSILKDANRQHLQMGALERGSQLRLTLSGAAKSLEKLCDMLYIEANNRAQASYYPPPNSSWPFQELCSLQQFVPITLGQGKFAKDSELILNEILGQLSFASDFKFPDPQKQTHEDDSK